MEEMSKYYCLYCRYYEPTLCGSEGNEPEGTCNNPHTAIANVFGHECCEDFNVRGEEEK